MLGGSPDEIQTQVLLPCIDFHYSCVGDLSRKNDTRLGIGRPPVAAIRKRLTDAAAFEAFIPRWAH